MGATTEVKKKITEASLTMARSIDNEMNATFEQEEASHEPAESLPYIVTS